MAISVFYYEAEPEGGYSADASLAYYFDADSVTIRKADHPDVAAFLAGGGVIQAYQPPLPPPTVDEMDTANLNRTLTEPGTVTRAMLKTLFNHENRIRALEAKAPITQAQFVAAVKVVMRNGG